MSLRLRVCCQQIPIWQILSPVIYRGLSGSSSRPFIFFCAPATAGPRGLRSLVVNVIAEDCPLHSGTHQIPSVPNSLEETSGPRLGQKPPPKKQRWLSAGGGFDGSAPSAKPLSGVRAHVRAPGPREDALFSFSLTPALAFLRRSERCSLINAGRRQGLKAAVLFVNEEESVLDGMGSRVFVATETACGLFLSRLTKPERS